jgi:hypothetical protein
VARITYNSSHNFDSEETNDSSVVVKDQLTFPLQGENFVPSKGGCNGKEMRRIMCVLNGDMQRFKVVDVDENEGDGEEMEIA